MPRLQDRRRAQGSRRRETQRREVTATQRLGNVLSSKWWLHRDGSQIQWDKNEEPLSLLTLFTERDKVVDQAWFDALERQTSSLYFAGDEDLREADELLMEKADLSDVFGYRSTVSDIRSRLSLMGFTAEACRRELEIGIYEGLEDSGSGDYLRVQDKTGFIVSVHKGEVLDLALSAYEAAQNGLLDDPVAEYCARHIELFIEAGLDRRVLLALQLEQAGPGGNVWLDLHDLGSAGYFEGIDDITQLAADELAVSVSSGGPVIVVTEGVTDAEFLKGALDLVAPQLSHMFRFFDKEAGAELNASQVVRTLRAFAAAGVTNRVVGVLDNDAAGRAAAKTLDAKPRPSNNRYILLPDVPYGASYPTRGPSGHDDLDINGRAVAIEFQFGLDALRPDGGELAKVEWSGREATVDAYQGGLSKVDKFAVQKNIRAFLKGASSDHDATEEPWPAVHGLIESLLSAAEPGSFPGQTHTYTASQKKY